MDDLVADGNSVLLVDHDVQVLSHADWIVELGPGAGAKGGTLVAEGTPAQLARNPRSVIGPFLHAEKKSHVESAESAERKSHAESAESAEKESHAESAENAEFSPDRAGGAIRLETAAIHTVKPLEVSFPKGLLSVVTGVSGSGKTALEACADLPLVRQRLQTLHDLGLGCLTLGEETPGLSGGEAQRLKLAGEMGRSQDDALFVFDEPTIGLHPLDVRTLLGVFRRLVARGATVIVIEHDLDVVRAADWVVDMGPGGGEAGGRIVAAGTPAQIAACPESLTGRYL